MPVYGDAEMARGVAVSYAAAPGLELMDLYRAASFKWIFAFVHVVVSLAALMLLHLVHCGWLYWCMMV